MKSCCDALQEVDDLTEVTQNQVNNKNDATTTKFFMVFSIHPGPHLELVSVGILENQPIFTGSRVSDPLYRLCSSSEGSFGEDGVGSIERTYLE